MTRHPPTLEDLPHQGDLLWLVERRSDVQGLLLELHTFLKAHRGTLEMNELDRETAGLLVGVAFSLWRALSLFDPARDVPIVLEHAEDFLDKLIRNNAIDHEREHRIKVWTVAYYLNNARFRLQSIVGKIGPELEMFAAFRTLDAGGITQAKARGAWQVLFDTLTSAFSLLRDVERVRAGGVSCPEPAERADRAKLTA